MMCGHCSRKQSLIDLRPPWLASCSYRSTWERQASADRKTAVCRLQPLIRKRQRLQLQLWVNAFLVIRCGVLHTLLDD